MRTIVVWKDEWRKVIDFSIKKHSDKHEQKYKQLVPHSEMRIKSQNMTSSW